jgi:hypothetical protein
VARQALLAFVYALVLGVLFLVVTAFPRGLRLFFSACHHAAVVPPSQAGRCWSSRGAAGQRRLGCGDDR